MFTVLIVDDEILVRIGVKNSIEWEKLGMKVIGDVSNGQAAFDFYQTYKPDLILTDIKMPLMDGIELITRIRENDSKTKIIILTCYEEFDLLHRAMKLGISDYVLKLKMNFAEMETVLKRVCQDMLLQNNTGSIKDELRIDKGLAKEKITKEYIFYNLHTDENFSDTVNSLNLRLSPQRIVLCVMAIREFKSMQSKFMDTQGNLIQFAVLNIVEELLNSYERGEIIHEKDERYILIFSFHDIVSRNKAYEELSNILMRINSVLELYLGASVTFGISGIYNNYSSMVAMYKECIDALEQSYFLAGNSCCIRKDMLGNRELGQILKDKLVKLLLSEAVSGNEEYKMEIERGLTELIEELPVKKASVQKTFIRWIHWPAIYVNSVKEDISQLALEFAENVHECETLDENIDKFLEYLKRISVLSRKARRISREVEEAVRYMKDNSHKDISLDQVAGVVEISASYLSSLFRKDMGTTFVDYLNKIRIDEAKRILLNTHMKSYEVARQVGFSDESYFSRTFKRYAGMRPNEFKRKWYLDEYNSKDAEEDLQ